MKLVIVESPTKARKLSEYLGREYTIEASVGHVRDLPKKKLGINIDDNFEPTYEVDADKQKVVKKLRDLAKSAEKIYLATDPDREGEAIAWHISQLLEGNKNSQHFARATFHEITKTAVLEAINNPSTISMDLVDAQQARRVVDRLVGYQVSPVLWKKVRRGLSAGRVQSVALRMIVEREREIEAFKPEEYWEVDVLLSLRDQQFKAAPSPLYLAKGEMSKPGWLDQAPPESLVARVIEVEALDKTEAQKYEPHQEKEVTDIISDLQGAHYQVINVEQKSRERASLPPFTTSTLQQAAANRLGFTSKQTMTLAQQLYEEGLITYHRTDSFSLSSQSLTMARGYIKQKFGDAYVPEKPRYFSTKSKNAQEAHEAIRVTDVHTTGDQVSHSSGRFTDKHAKLYDLIWRRFLACQMNSAVYDQTTILIKGEPKTKTKAKSYTLKSAGSVLKFDGWMKLFSSNEDTILPPVKDNQNLFYQDLSGVQKFTQPPARYNDASLVKELEKRGIGRPSTYASIISVIVDRGYVERKEKRFFATPIGMTVSDFLQQYFPVFMEYDFTAEMEEDLDRISRGEKPWRKVVKEFYSPLEKIIKTVTKEAERVQIPVEETGETCPLCGETEGGKLVIRTGRFGKFKSCNRFPECKFTENIVEKLENVVCPLCQKGEVILKNSRWGKPFYGCSRYPDCTWASWKKPQPGETITQEQWDKLQAERKAKLAARSATRSGTKSRAGSRAKTRTKTRTKSRASTSSSSASRASKSRKKPSARQAKGD